MQIALLEDNPSLVEWLSTALEMSGHHIHVYRDGPSLLAYLLAIENIPFSLPFDLLLVDLFLPGGMSGWDVINSLRTTIPPEHLPIIVISGASLNELDHLQASHPDIPVLQKPYQLRRLLWWIKILTSE
jgi:DNA-binding response OmpR family regulator